MNERRVSAFEKDRSVIDTVTALRGRLGDGLIVVDHWDADPMAIGVATADDTRRLVYFSTLKRSLNQYHVELEFPPHADSELPYEQGERFDDVDFEELVSIVAHHLGLEESGPNRLRHN